MGRPKKTDETLLIGLLDKYYAEVACGDAGGIRYTDLARYAAQQGEAVNDYDFRRSSGVRARLEELKAMDRKEDTIDGELIYKGLDIDGMIRTCRDLSDLKRSLQEMDTYWKAVYDRQAKTDKRYREALARRSDAEKAVLSLKGEIERTGSLYQDSEDENQKLRKENAYLRSMLEKYLYPDLARKLMQEAHLPVSEPQNATKEAFAEMIEGKRPDPYRGAQKGKDRPLTKEEQLLEELRRQAEE